MSPICGLDLYHGDFGDSIRGKKPDWDRYFDLGSPWHFWIIKCADGANGQDFGSEAIADFRHVAHARGLYNVTQFVGAYTFCRSNVDPAKQADALVHKMDISGLLKDPSMIPWLDVERDKQAAASESDTGWQSADHVIQVIGAIAARVHALTGRAPGFYGRTVWNDLNVPTMAGCAANWNPDYSSDGHHHMKNPPVTRDKAILRQYVDSSKGKNISAFPDFPLFGADLNVWLGRTDAEAESLDAFRETMCTGAGAGGFAATAAIATGLGIVALT